MAGCQRSALTSGPQGQTALREGCSEFQRGMGPRFHTREYFYSYFFKRQVGLDSKGCKPQKFCSVVQTRARLCWLYSFL